MRRIALFLLLLTTPLWSQTETTPYRLRMPDSTYSAQLRGVAGTRTEGKTVQGTWSTYFKMHSFPVVLTGKYKLYVDPTGGSSYTIVSSWGGTYGKAVPGQDMSAFWEYLNATNQLLSIGVGDTSISYSKIKCTEIDTTVLFTAVDSCIHRYDTFVDPIAEIYPYSDHAVWVIRVTADSVVVGIPTIGMGDSVKYKIMIKER